jgi:hypothetical protein
MLLKKIFNYFLFTFTAVFIVVIFNSLSTSAFAINYSTDVVSKRVFLLIFNPTVNDTGTKLIQFQGYSSPDTLSTQLVDFMRNNSHGILRYQIAQRADVDSFAIKEDGYTYTKEEYLACLSGGGCHTPDTADYASIINTYNLCGKLNSGEIDEVWMWGGPSFGFSEARLAGASAYSFPGSAVNGTTCSRLLPIMAFGYDKGLTEAAIAFAHRVDSTMAVAYGGWDFNSNSNNWNRFTFNVGNSSSQSVFGCGSSSFPPNGVSAGDWGNSSSVDSFCDQFNTNWPEVNVTGTKRSISCSEWGCNGLGYLTWWFGKIPAYNGVAADGKYSDWWRYIGDPNKVYEAAYCNPVCSGKLCGAEDSCGGRCATGICNQPSGNSCISAKGLRQYYSTGTCKPDYTCEYSYKDLYCAFGCDAGTVRCNGCTPNCSGKECGSDGCGGLCVACTNGKVCVQDSKCVEYELVGVGGKGNNLEIGTLNVTDFGTGEVVQVVKEKTILELAQENIFYVATGLGALLIIIIACVLVVLVKKGKIKLNIKNPFAKKTIISEIPATLDSSLSKKPDELEVKEEVKSSDEIKKI